MSVERPEPMLLWAGPLTMLFEPDIAFLRYIRYGDHEVLRGINAPVRDQNWGTVAPRVTSLALKETEGGITLSFDGIAKTSFWRNRIGFCVLHPIAECKGAPCRIETVDGQVFQDVFPTDISPHQPFKNLKAIAHRVAGDLWARVAFEGDVFEMEDQRNWTDASFKTYCTPLELPFPVKVEKGERVRQRVTLTFEGSPVSSARGLHAGPIAVTDVREPGVVQVEVSDRGGIPMPPIGLEIAADREVSDGRAASRLRALELSHLRLEVPFHKADWEERLRRGIRVAQEVGVPLEMALILTDDALAPGGALDRALDQLQPADVTRWTVFQRDEKSTSAKRVSAVRERLRGRFEGSAVGGGTNAFFAELNRGRPSQDAVDFVTYSINPQVHAFDELSIVETLEAQADTVSTARSFSGGKPVIVSPVSLRPRFNPNATSSDAGEDDASKTDPRQGTTYTAGWTAASIGRLALAGASALTYFETVGGRGVMEQAVFPVYHVFAECGAMRGGEILPLRSSEALAVDGLALIKGDHVKAILSNFSLEPRCVRLVWSGLRAHVRVKLLGPHTEDALHNPESFRARSGLMQETDDGSVLLALPPRTLAVVTSGPESNG